MANDEDILKTDFGRAKVFLFHRDDDDNDNDDNDHHDDDHDDNIDGEHLQQWLTQPIGHTIDNHTLPHQKIYNTPYTK